MAKPNRAFAPMANVHLTVQIAIVIASSSEAEVPEEAAPQLAPYRPEKVRYWRARLRERLAYANSREFVELVWVLDGFGEELPFVLLVMRRHLLRLPSQSALPRQLHRRLGT